MSVSAIKGVSELVKLCLAHGVQHVVVSPGSRNAPLSITFDHTNGIDTCVIPDERSAGFFALGIALATQKPVAIVCTSGSAAYNYAPAVSEAFYQKVPLIVITADRPQAWINQGDGQTIMQPEIYGNHVLKSVNLPVIENNEDEWLHNRLANEALITVQGKVKGPVHINVPFKEPLYERTKVTDLVPRKMVKVDTVAQLSAEDLGYFVQQWSSARKVLLLVGQGPYNAWFNELVQRVTDLHNTAVLTEVTSNISGEVVSTIDRCIDGFTPEQKKQFAPDILVTAGDAIVSKKVKAWIRQAKPRQHWHVGHEHQVPDTYACLTHHIPVKAEGFLGEVLPEINSAEGSFAREWKILRVKMAEKHAQFAAKVTWSDFKVFGHILQRLPSCNLHLGNSTPIRYAQLFEMRNDIEYFSNRGTSGIDGCSSTAAGIAYVSEKLNVLITGDVSFYYDSNAWWNNYLRGNLKIVLINNKGGNIFRIIDGPNDEKLTQQYFEAKQEMKAEFLCRQFNIGYFSATNEKELEKQFEQFLAPADRPVLIEVFTDNIISPQTLKDYFNYLKGDSLQRDE